MTFSPVPTCERCRLPSQVCECHLEHNIKTECVLCYSDIDPLEFFEKGNFCSECCSWCAKQSREPKSEDSTYLDYLLDAGYEPKRIIKEI